MARIELAPGVLDGFDRFFDHMAQGDPASAPRRIDEIVQAPQVPATSPLIGRPVKGGMRELVIGHASRGYVALYRYAAPVDMVFVLAVRSQRESDTGATAEQTGPARSGPTRAAPSCTQACSTRAPSK